MLAKSEKYARLNVLVRNIAEDDGSVISKSPGHSTRNDEGNATQKNVKNNGKIERGDRAPLANTTSSSETKENPTSKFDNMIIANIHPLNGTDPTRRHANMWCSAAQR